MSLAMTREEREQFLADRHVGVIAIQQPDAPPLAVPVWYDYSPDRGVWLVTGEQSLKGRRLKEAGRFSLVAQTEEAPYQYVSVEGPIVETVEADLERHRRPMAHRYLGPELGDAYVAGTDSAGQLVFTMRPERWRTVDYGKLGSL